MDEKAAVSFFSYLLRHWRGELSLKLSFWLNGVALSAAVVGLLTLLQTIAPFGETEHLVRLSVFFTGLWLFGIAVWVWQAVGCWRAAGNAMGHASNRWPWAARTLVIVGTVMAASNAYTSAPTIEQYVRIITGTGPFAGYEVFIGPNRAVVYVVGGMGAGITKAARNKLDENPQANTVSLTSRGGRIGEARALRRLIQERGLATIVNVECLSACVIPFSGGNARVLVKDSKIGLHGYAFPGLGKKQIQAEEAKDAGAFTAAGVTPEFMQKAFATPASDMWYPTEAELLEGGLITAVVERPEG